MFCMTKFNNQFNTIFKGTATMDPKQNYQTEEERLKELEKLKRLKDSDDQLIPPGSKPLRG